MNRKDIRRQWTPTYKTWKGTLYTIAGVQVNECPVSVITPKSRDLIQLFSRLQSLKELGVSTYAEGDIPIPLADAFVILSNEEKKCESTRSNYESFDRGNGL